MADAFPWDRQPRLKDWIASSGQAAVKAAVESALATDGAVPAADELAQALRRPAITLGRQSYLDQPWRRSMTAGPDGSSVLQGRYPGQQYTQNYDQYLLTVDTGVECVTQGSNGGPFIDPMFVFVRGGDIVVRSADDAHRDRLISDIENHVQRANAVIEDWNQNGLPAAVDREIDRAAKHLEHTRRRTGAKEAAGFERASAKPVRPVPLPDQKYSPPPKPSAPEPVLAGASFGLTAGQFANILDCIAAHREQIERMPGAGAPAKGKEDDHRDRLLLSLNMRFRDATGESFSKKGKTDIRLVVDDHAYFYAECKIWRSVTSISDALSQLTDRYLIARDQYGALIMFVRDEPHPRSLVGHAVDHLVDKHGASKAGDLNGFPVVRINEGTGQHCDLAVIFITVDSAPPRK